MIKYCGMAKSRFRNLSFRQSLLCAIAGACKGFLDEPNFRRQVVVGVGVFIVAWWLGLEAWKVAILVLASANVLAIELVNSSLEAALDVLHPDYHETIERVKDMAAGAVLLASVGAVVVGVLLLARPMMDRF